MFQSNLPAEIRIKNNCFCEFRIKSWAIIVWIICVYFAARENLKAAKKEFNKTEDDLKSLQSVGQIIGEVLRPLDNERCMFLFPP